jgi:hypothetical protein
MQQQPAQSQQPGQQYTPLQAQQQYAPGAPPIAPMKKKSKAPLFVGILVAVIVVIAVSIALIANAASSQLLKTAQADYHEIANDKIPSVMFLIGEERTVTGVSSSSNSDGSKQLEITYKTQAGEDSQMDMYYYAVDLCDNYGFYSINDNDFSGSTGTNFQFAKESKTPGYLVIVRIDYDRNGFVVTYTISKGTLTPN